MAQNIFHVLFWLSCVWPSLCADIDLEPDFPEDRWIFRHSQMDRKQENEIACSAVKPSARDIVRRFYAILPYFDKDHTNTAFLHKFRGTVYSMSDSEDMLDREAGFYAAVLSPLVFLQQYRDTWCFLERFHRALRLYQISHPTEKRSALKLLQNLRAVNQKVKGFIFELPGPEQVTRTTPALDDDEDTLHDKKDIRYLKELIKNLGIRGSGFFKGRLMLYKFKSYCNDITVKIANHSLFSIQQVDTYPPGGSTPWINECPALITGWT